LTPGSLKKLLPPTRAWAIGEGLVIGLLGSPIFFASLAVVTGGGREAAADAAPRVVRLYRVLLDEHLARCRAAGLDREPEQSPFAAFVGEIEA